MIRIAQLSDERGRTPAGARGEVAALNSYCAMGEELPEFCGAAGPPPLPAHPRVPVAYTPAPPGLWSDERGECTEASGCV